MKPLLFILFISAIAHSNSNAQPPGQSRPGPWSAGVFVAFDSQPYKDSGREFNIFPSINYRGERLQWNGPLLQYTLLKRETWNFGIHTVFQFAPYEEDDADILQGMGDRSDTLLAGLDWRYRPHPTWNIYASLDGEILGAYDGIQATTGVSRALGKPWHRVSGSLGVGLLLQDQNWTRYFVGVPASKADSNRAAHDPEESFHPFLSGRMLFRINQDWSWITLARYEFLDSTWINSPLIGDSYRLFAFTSVAYSF